MRIKAVNPVTGLDYPDPDVIRVDDTYYMVSTTMYFMPGCEILRSYDLCSWEHAAYVYTRLDGTEKQRLERGGHIYGKGMWAASLRYHKGKFYICFVCNDTGKTYLYISDTVEGPWEKRSVEGFYHDCSLLFDEDDRIYIAYGNRDIYITQLKPDLSGPLEGGLHRIAVSDKDNPNLGFEGSHFYKLNGKYYLFLIHSLKDRWMRTEACFVSDSLEGEFTGGDILTDDMGFYGQGVAQGGIVDTPEGDWYGVLFQDRGAVGRIPVLVPVAWKEDHPVFGIEGKAPKTLMVRSQNPEYDYEPLVQSDDFRATAEERAEKRASYDCCGLKSAWQFNHEPDLSMVRLDPQKGILWIGADRLCDDLLSARNTITQRMRFPGCFGEVTVDAGCLKEGDYAGICALQGCYGMAAVTKRGGRNVIVMISRDRVSSPNGGSDMWVTEWETVPVTENIVRLRVDADFGERKDTAVFFCHDGTGWRKIGVSHKLFFGLDHFTGCRFGLFMYATRETGGRAGFRNFIYSGKDYGGTNEEKG